MLEWLTINLRAGEHHNYLHWTCRCRWRTHAANELRPAQHKKKTYEADKALAAEKTSIATTLKAAAEGYSVVVRYGECASVSAKEA